MSKNSRKDLEMTPKQTTFFASNAHYCPGRCCGMKRQPFSFRESVQKEDQLDLSLHFGGLNGNTCM